MRFSFIRPIIAIGLSLFFFFGCVDKFDPKLNLGANVVTVEAVLNNLPEAQRVSLKYSESVASSTFERPISKAQVEIVVNGKDIVVGTEQEAGAYYLPSDFRVKTGSTYQLKFRLADGKQYESDIETMSTVPEITKVYDEFQAKAIETTSGDGRLASIPGNWVYVDTKDPGGVRNFYQWAFTLWEKQSICATCDRGLFYPISGSQRNVCIANNRLPAGTIYDYFCESSCWQIYYNQELNVMADTYSDGKPIIGRLAAKIPYYSRDPALVEIRQYSLSPGAFRYLKLLADQSQNTGSLADTPPAPIVGNVRNVSNPEEPVVGYFQASGIASIRYWLDRQNASSFAGRPTGLLNGREIMPEPMGADLTRPPFAPCLPSISRTPIKPTGWK